MKLGRIAFPWDSITQNVLVWVPWWLSGEESACQCRRHEFDPWSGKISPAAKQLSLCALEPELCDKRSHDHDKPVHCSQGVVPTCHN